MSEQQIMKKSIFKQEVYNKVYEPKLEFIDDRGYWLRGSTRYSLSKCSNQVSQGYTDLITVDIPMPILGIGALFYIEELDKTVEIKQSARTSLDNIVYYVQPEIIDDEESLAKVEDLLESNKYKDLIEKSMYDDAKCELYKLEKSIKDYNSLPFYRKIFSKIKIDK